MSVLARRGFLGGAAALGVAAATGAKGAETSSAAALAQTCQPLTGLTFDDAEQQQMLGAVDDIVERARAIAALELDNALCPAELFDPRLPGWQPRAPLAAATTTPALPPLPKDAEDIALAPAWQLSAWIRNGRLTARRLTEIYLQRIAARAGRLECVAALMADAARAEADERDRELAAGKWRGPLHGLPYGLKDLIDTAGVQTAWGAEPYKERVPERDAVIVTRLREAGAVLLAKTTCGAIAYGDIWYGGRTRNPWNVEEGSSGSSAGSAAAVADGLCAFAIGTETMGSIVSPSARCGTVGLRPTFGRVPRSGAMALCWSLDKIGVLARDPRDTMPVLAVMHGSDGADPCASDVALASQPAIQPGAITIGYRPEWFEKGTPADKAALQAARAAGFRLVEVTMPDIDLAQLGGIVVLEAAAAFEELTASGKDDQMKWQDAAAWPNSWRAAHFEVAVNYIQAQRLRRKLMHAFAQTIAGVDAILHPNGAGGLLPIGNHCGYPALVLPAALLDQPTRTGFTSYVAPADIEPGAALHKVPFGVTLTGHLYDEGRLTAIGQRLADELALGTLRPPMRRG
jgi:Asp-tRNAAsn/Glu-tRNAGln amidotransferase A subunit and related amidases